MREQQLRRDESGRLLADDGYPLGGLATVSDVAAVGSLAPSTVYRMVEDGELESKRFGRAVRIPWTAIRQKFLDDRA